MFNFLQKSPDLSPDVVRLLSEAPSPKLQEEFGSRSEFEERATAYHFANALAILKACNERQAAEEMFQAGST